MKSLKIMLLALAALVISDVAFAQNRSSVVAVGTLTNCNAAGMASAIDCEVRNTAWGVNSVIGYNLLTIEVLQDVDGDGTSTGFSFQLEACSEGLAASDCTTDSDWFLVNGESYSAGTMTLAGGTFSKTEDVANEDIRMMYSIGINYMRLRIANITALSQQEAGDTITIKAWLAGSGAF